MVTTDADAPSDQVQRTPWTRWVWLAVLVIISVPFAIALVVVGIFLTVVLLFEFSGGYCSDLDSLEVTSPDGRYVARYSARSCGGVLGSAFSQVTVRDAAGPKPDDSESRVVADDLARDLRARWADTNTLIIEYNLPASTMVTKGVFLECDAWRDITITCQAVTAIQKHQNPIESIVSGLERGESTATIGSSGVFLALTEGEAEVLGTEWVGPDYTKSYNQYHTAYTLTSQDGRRVYRSPEIDPRDIRAGHSKTGRQAIFEQFSPAQDKWQVVRVEVFDLEQHIERQQALLQALEAAAAGTEPTTRLRFGSGFAVLGAGEALALGRQWVGGDPRNRVATDGVVRLVSADGEREYLGPRRVPDGDDNGVAARMQATFIVNSPGEGIQREVRVEILRASQAVPPAPSTRPLFIETFDSPAAGKLPQLSPDPARFQAGYAGGEYVIRLTEPGEAALAKVDLPGTYLAASISVDARLVGETADAVIIVGCRVNPSYQEEFRFMLDPGRRQYRFSRWVNGKDERPGNWEHYASINQGDESNRIGVYCGRVIGIDFNDGPPIQTMYEQIPEGLDRVSFKPEGGIWIGVGTIGERSTPVEARFDNLVVQDSQCFRPDDTRC